jgi:hypothetical protein
MGAMTRLNISKNGLLTQEGGRALGNMLKANIMLKELDISDSGNGMRSSQRDGPGFATAILEGLAAGNGALSKLDLRQNALFVQGRQKIWTLCKSKGISLDIEEDGLVEGQDDSSSQEEAEVKTLVIGGITVESTMTEADFSGKALKEAEVIALAAFLPKCR